MANNLTGDFEAVLEVTLRQLNGILATLHQNAVDPNATPKFPHSCSVRIGDRPPWLEDDASRFAEFVTKVAPSNAGITAQSAAAARDAILQKTPPGATERAVSAWDGLNADHFGHPTGRVRGRADVQISAPTVSLPPDSVSKVLVHAFVRARFYPDDGARSLPAPIHGEVTALYGARPMVLPDGRKVLRVEVSADNNDIQFIPDPGTGLNAADTNAIANEVRATLRKHFVPMDVTLSNDFALAEFVSRGFGPSESLLLPIQLSGGSPVGNIQSATNHFIGSSEFAIAVSREYIQRFIDALLNAIRGSISRLRFTLHSVLGSADYTASASRLDVVWKPGALEISGRIELVTSPWWAPNGFVSFSQSVGVVLDPVSQAVSVVALGDPSVDESWFIQHGTALNSVKSARDSALPGASAAFNAAFADARGKLASALATFDHSSSVTYTEIELSQDGIIVRGSIGTKFRYDPIVSYQAIEGGFAFDAVRSWIPGGRIDSFEWTWLERTHLIPWENKTRQMFIDHEFVAPKPPEVDPGDVKGICLQILGRRTNSNGILESVAAGTVCSNSSHEPFLVHPSWWMNLFIPEWLPDPPPDVILNDLIASHVSVTTDSAGPDHLTANTIVHFPGAELARPLEQLSDAMRRMTRGQVAMRAVLVLPQGSFKMRSRELQERVGPIGENVRGQILVTEDILGGWTQAFKVDAGPSTHVINGRGDFVFRHDGHLSSSDMAHALDRVVIDTPRPRFVPLQLNVRSGMPAPDCVFTEINGNQIALRRLLGRKVLIVFWQSWSSPSVRELRRLRDMHAQKDGPFILAVNGGELLEVQRALRDRERLSYAVIHDPEQKISAMYGVRSWPTTVRINQESIVESVQFGLTHEHAKPAVAAV